MLPRLQTLSALKTRKRTGTCGGLTGLSCRPCCTKWKLTREQTIYPRFSKLLAKICWPRTWCWCRNRCLKNSISFHRLGFCQMIQKVLKSNLTAKGLKLSSLSRSGIAKVLVFSWRVTSIGWFRGNIMLRKSTSINLCLSMVSSSTSGSTCWWLASRHSGATSIRKVSRDLQLSSTRVRWAATSTTSACTWQTTPLTRTASSSSRTKIKQGMT